MKTIQANEGQNIYDLAIQELGGVDAATLIAIQNGLTFDAALESGQELEIDPEETENQALVDWFRRGEKEEKVKTGNITDDLGIGQMGIEFTFIVR